jgi:hypothetical protein
VAAEPGPEDLLVEPLRTRAGGGRRRIRPEDIQIDVEEDAVEPGDRLGRELDLRDRPRLAVVIELLAEVDQVFRRLGGERFDG